MHIGRGVYPAHHRELTGLETIEGILVVLIRADGQPVTDLEAGLSVYDTFARRLR